MYDIPTQTFKNEKKIRLKKFDAATEETFEEKYTGYLEEYDHVLFGWKTPMFIARIDSMDQVIYDKVDYVRVVKIIYQKFIF